MKVYQVADWEQFENYKSRERVQCNWFCAPNEITAKLRRLLKQRQGPAIYGVHHLILGLCSRQKAPRAGWLTDDGRPDGEPLTVADLAREFTLPAGLIEEALAALSHPRIGWLVARKAGTGAGAGEVHEHPEPYPKRTRKAGTKAPAEVPAQVPPEVNRTEVKRTEEQLTANGEAAVLGQAPEETAGASRPMPLTINDLRLTDLPDGTGVREQPSGNGKDAPALPPEPCPLNPDVRNDGGISAEALPAVHVPEAEAAGAETACPIEAKPPQRGGCTLGASPDTQEPALPAPQPSPSLSEAPADFATWSIFAEQLRKAGLGDDFVRRVLKQARSWARWPHKVAEGRAVGTVAAPDVAWLQWLVSLALFMQRQADVREPVAYFMDLVGRKVQPPDEVRTTAKLGWQYLERDAEKCATTSLRMQRSLEGLLREVTREVPGPAAVPGEQRNRQLARARML